MLKQKLLVLYAASASPDSPVGAWSLFDGTGRETHMAGDENEPPYSSVLAAMRDGWRVIQLPQLAGRRAAAPSTTTAFLPYEFVLEKLVEVDADGAPPTALTSLQVAGFVADGALRFDGIVPRALSDAALAELAGGGPAVAVRRRSRQPRRTRGPGARSPGCSATGRRSPRCSSCRPSLRSSTAWSAPIRSTTTTTRT